MSRRLRGLRDRDWRVIDRMIAAGFGAAVVVDVLLFDGLVGPTILNLIAYLGIASTLLVRRSRPVVAVTALIVLAAVCSAWLTPPPDLTVAAIILVAANYSVGAHCEQRQALLGLLIGVVGTVGLAIAYDPGDAVFPPLVFAFAPWFIGRVLRSQLLLTRELAEKADRSERDRELHEARAVAEERRRVARELHDVLAHDLSVIVVQASAARRIVEADPGRAVEAAGLIERTGREALAELRHLFGAVRRGEAEPLEGTPSVARIDRLARRARAAGLPVELRVEGQPRELPAGVDLAGYRVVQEALTNALRHAGPARATVTVRYRPDVLVLEVSDDGAGANGAGGREITGGGHGLVGMRERVALYGGELATGRPRGGGFTVRATVPLAEATR